MRRMAPRSRPLVFAAAAIALVLSTTVQAAPIRAAEIPHSAAFTVNLKWTQTLGDAGNPIVALVAQLANLDGQPAVVVGDRGGRAYAYHINDGSGVGGWPYYTGAPVDSSPSVAPINANGLDTVYVGAGNPASPTAGGYFAIAPNGQNQWYVQETNPGTDPTPHNSVQASMTVGAYAGGYGVEAGSLGRKPTRWAPGTARRSLASRGSPTRSSRPRQWPISTPTTTTRSSAAGNRLRAPRTARRTPTGAKSGSSRAPAILRTGNPAGGLICHYDTTQNIAGSSPAVGQFLANGGVGIAIGDGSYYQSSDTNKIFALNTGCGLAWSDTLNGQTSDSPALADVEGNGQLDVVEGTQAGTVYVLNGTNGAIIWSAPTSGQVIGSPVTADLTGAGYQDVIVPTISGIDIFDGRSGSKVTTLNGGNNGFESSPLVTDDPDGHIGITGAGYNYGSNRGVILHWEIDNTAGSGASVDQKGAWPQFHHDPQLTGDAGTPPPTIGVPCNAPSGGPDGYLLSASDGGVFDYGNIPFCGSTGAYPPQQACGCDRPDP